MNKAKILIYDGSFNGFLTAVFIAFEEGITVADIRINGQGQNGLFSETQNVFTQLDKAKRVWKGIQNKSNSAIKNIYFAFLSESMNIEFQLYRYIQKLFANDKIISSDYSDDVILKINQLAKMVSREKQRMETFVRFQLTKDTIYFASIAPDVNVLPLISKHFRARYADQHWIIYDVQRKYGLYYDLEGVELISLDLKGVYANSIIKSDTFSGEEYSYQELWNNYFRNTSIKPHINRTLHIQYTSKRYRKYLKEKKVV